MRTRAPAGSPTPPLVAGGGDAGDETVAAQVPAARAACAGGVGPPSRTAVARPADRGKVAGELARAQAGQDGGGPPLGDAAGAVTGLPAGHWRRHRSHEYRRWQRTTRPEAMTWEMETMAEDDALTGEGGQVPGKLPGKEDAKAEGKAQQATEKVKDTVHEVGEKAKEAVHDVSEKAKGLVDRIRHKDQ